MTVTTPSHVARNSIKPNMWTPNSPDLNLLDYHLGWPSVDGPTIMKFRLSWLTETNNHRCMAETAAVFHWQESISQWCNCMEFVVWENGGGYIERTTRKMLKCWLCAAVLLLLVCSVHFWCRKEHKLSSFVTCFMVIVIRWREPFYFPKLNQINCNFTLRMKWP